MIALLLCTVVAYAQGLAGFLSPGPLSKDHAEIDTLTGCPKCHEVGSGVSATRCMACHESVAEQVSSNTGFHANKGKACQSCHHDHLGRDHRMIDFGQSDQTGFDHSLTGFALDGPHQEAECTACHTTEGDWTGLEPSCRSCHDDPHGASASTRRLLLECESCHKVVKDWKVTRIAASIFDHTDPKQVGWVLEGAHVDIDCGDCHVDAAFVPTRHDACTDCHEDPHRAPFSNDCTTCHNVRSWGVAGFDHARTGWALVGQHTTVSCESCHHQSTTRPLKHETCSDCHTDIHRHQFDPRPCDTCHTLSEAGFRIARFDHDRTDYPLHGRHVTVACADCHGAGPSARYADRPAADCDECHKDPHAAKFEPTQCRSCHVEDGWAVADFDHDRTRFPLVASHEKVECAACHPNEQWTGILHGSCRDCHGDEDPHEDDFAPERCDECHAETAWVDVTFDHGTTDFSLAPQHGAVACTGCHEPKSFAGVEPTCGTCHADAKPVLHYGDTCGDCHHEAEWLPADLGDGDHDITGFPLEGVHSLQPCESCHPADRPHGDAVGTCAACHSDDDVHRHQLGDACADCHTPTTWVRTRFRHFSTGWSLRGAHRLVACDNCHATGYIATPSTCAACHGGEADPSIPAHRSIFAADCERCHQPFTWAAPGYGHGK